MSTLYIVATPIGNLEDFSYRAQSILREADLIAAEDKRRTGHLLARYEINTSLIAYHAHNEDANLQRMLGLLKQGNSIALVSDAGTPLISDPGYQLVRECMKEGIPVVPIPGPSSVVTALSVAGIPTHRFAFEGFPPAKARARRELFASMAVEPRTMVFFEAPHRIKTCLVDMKEIFGASRPASICRELTKTFEQIRFGSLDALCAEIASGAIPERGEFVVVVEGSTAEKMPASDALIRELIKELPPSKVASIVASITGESRSVVYDRALELKPRIVD